MELFLIPLILTIFFTSTGVIVLLSFCARSLIFKNNASISIGEFEKAADKLLFNVFIVCLCCVTGVWITLGG